MRHTAIALGVGLAVGVGVALVLVERSASVEAGAPVSAAVLGDQATVEADLERAEALVRSSFNGVVVHVVRDGAPVAGARLSLFRRLPSRWVDAGGAVTDTRGDGALPAAPGRHLVVAAAGDRQAMVVVDVAHSSTATVAEVVLGPPRRATGRVVEAGTQTPLTDALVRWQASDDGVEVPGALRAVTTHAFGRFELELPSGDCQGVLTAADALHAAGQVPWAEAEVELVLERAALVAGVVVDASGHPVAGASVRTAGDEASAEVSDAQGRFELKVHPGGDTVLAVAPSGLQALERVRLAAGERRGDLRLVVARGRSMEGRVVAGEGVGLSGAEVVVQAEPDALEVARLISGTDGAFTAVELPAGRYTVLAMTSRGWRGQVVGVEDFSRPVEVRVIEGASVQGTVRLASGVPAAFALLSLERSSMLHEPAVVARADEAGRFTMVDVLPGDFVIRARLAAIGEVLQRSYVAPGGVAVVDLTLRARGTLHGRAHGASGQEVLVRGEVVLGSQRVTLDAAGEFTLELPAGDYQVFLPDRPHAIQGMASVWVREGEVTDVDLEAAAAANPLARPRPSAMGMSFDNGVGGVQVGFLSADSPAAEAGLKSGDLILAIGGEPVRDTLDAFARVRGRSELRFSVRRDGTDREIVVRDGSP